MVRKSIEERVLTLEQQMSELREIPSRVSLVESNISQLRTEMRAGFSAIRGEMATFRAEMVAGDEETRRQMRVLHEDLVGRIALLQEAMPRSGRRRKSR